MKKIILLSTLIFSFGSAWAQRFFYIDNNRVTENILKKTLRDAAQFITSSPLSADYIIKTEVGFRPETNMLTLQINLQDSLTLQTIYQTRETYTFGNLHTNSRIILDTMIQAFIEKNIARIVISAREDHMDYQMKWLKTRKDKI
jgi:hypothetical protein